MSNIKESTDIDDESVNKMFDYYSGDVNNGYIPDIYDKAQGNEPDIDELFAEEDQRLQQQQQQKQQQIQHISDDESINKMFDYYIPDSYDESVNKMFDYGYIPDSDDESVNKMFDYYSGDVNNGYIPDIYDKAHGNEPDIDELFAEEEQRLQQQQQK
jgi:hypothetical protein